MWYNVSMFKGIRLAIGVAITFFMFPAIAWSEPEVPGYPAAPETVAYVFPTREGWPDANKLISEVNKVRLGAGMQPLRPDNSLSDIARQRAADMSVRQYYSHKSPGGLYYYDLMAAKSMNPGYSCENLDLVFAYSESGVISDWLNSTKGHKECMLKPDAYKTGLAIVPFTTTQENGPDKNIYLVVAIHSTAN